MKKFFTKQRIAAYAMMIIAFVVVALFCPQEVLTYDEYDEVEATVDSDAGEEMPAEYQVDFGAWTLMVPVLMFAFVLLTHAFLEAFVWAAALTTFMRFRWAVIPAWTNMQISVLTDYDNIRMVILYLTIGSVLAAISLGGGAKAFAQWIKSKAKSPKLSLVVMWLMDIVLSIDDELSAFTTGAAITPIADSYGIPREKSAFMIRASAVAPANLWPLGAWTVFVAALLEQCGFAKSGSGVVEYMKAVPYMFFPMLILIIGLLVALGVIPDIGKMKKATQRVANGGPVAPVASGHVGETSTEIEEDHFESEFKPSVLNIILPIAVMLGAAALHGFDVMIGIVACLVFCFFYFIARGICTPTEYLDKVLINGMKSMMMLTTLFAVSLVMVYNLDYMGFAQYVIDATSQFLSAQMLPFIIFVVFAFTEFLVSFNWTLYMMALPIVIPLAQVTGANVYLAIAALVCTGIWGSQGCMYSDGAIVAAAATNTDPYESSTCSLPYMVIACVLTAIGFLIAGFVLA